MLRRSTLVIAALVAGPMLGACNADGSGTDTGDCNARIRYEGVLYRPHNALNQAAPSGNSLGEGEVVDCGDVDTAPRVDTVTVSSVKGVETSVAVVVGQGQWRGVYVAEDLPRTEWPGVLSEPKKS